jgi:hypothetical protein
VKIILLTGNPRTGKTTTFNMVYDQLTQGMSPLPTKYKIKGGSANDFECTLMYKRKDIAIFSMGDHLHRIYEAIIKYINKDVLIIAHSKGGYVMDKIPRNIARYRSPPHSLHCVINKTVSRNPNNNAMNIANNTIDCQTIISNI